MLKVAVTGHRPERIGGYDGDNPTRVWIKEALREVVDTLRPNYAYSGMALGVDQDFVEVCVEKGIPFTAVVPFRAQAEKWPSASQFIYYDLVKKARERVIVCDPGYAAWKLQRRNEWMVDAIDDEGVVIAVWDGTPGGTANCVRYARHSDRCIVRINPATKEIIY